nr:ALPV-174 [Albatrosspox virus]
MRYKILMNVRTRYIVLSILIRSVYFNNYAPQIWGGGHFSTFRSFRLL